MLRAKDFTVYYDKKVLIKPTDFELTLQKGVNEIFPKIYRQGTMYRSTGIVLEQLSFDGEQLSLFSDGAEKEQNLSKCIDNIEKRFGKNAIRTGF